MTSRLRCIASALLIVSACGRSSTASPPVAPANGTGRPESTAAPPTHEMPRAPEPVVAEAEPPPPPAALRDAVASLLAVTNRAPDVTFETDPCDGTENCELSKTMSIWWAAVSADYVVFVEQSRTEAPMAEEPCEPRTRVRMCGLALGASECAWTVEGKRWASECVLAPDDAAPGTFFSSADAARIAEALVSMGEVAPIARVDVRRRRTRALLEHLVRAPDVAATVRVSLELPAGYDFVPRYRVE